MPNPGRRLRRAATLLAAVVAVGSAGYVALGFTVLDAIYQTVTTVTTVGFREVEPLDNTGKTYTIVVVLVGVGTALFTLGALIETLVEGRLTDAYGRRRMQRRIDSMAGHVIVCGWGRVGRTVASFVTGAGGDVVVIERDPERLETIPHAFVDGEATDDAVLHQAGITRARALIAAVTTDADNLFITLSGRSLNQGLFIVARARLEAAEDKLVRAGANRVVNPQQIGGARMAAFALQPHVAEFMDVVMHDGSLEFRLEEIPLPAESPLAGLTLREAHIRDRTGALVLALRDGSGDFTTNPPPETVMQPGHVLIAIGTSAQLESLVSAAAG